MYRTAQKLDERNVSIKNASMLFSPNPAFCFSRNLVIKGPKQVYSITITCIIFFMISFINGIWLTDSGECKHGDSAMIEILSATHSHFSAPLVEPEPQRLWNSIFHNYCVQGLHLLEVLLYDPAQFFRLNWPRLVGGHQNYSQEPPSVSNRWWFLVITLMIALRRPRTTR